MTYCLSMMCDGGLVFVSDTRSNAGMDNIATHRKMHVYEQANDRVICLQSSGNLSLTQSTLALIEEDLLSGKISPEHPNILNQKTMFETARYVGQKIREVEVLDREFLEKDDFKFNVHFLVGGQIGGLPHAILYVYPQGNVMHASQDSPFLQIGESKYGKPILDRGFTCNTPLGEAVKLGVLSMDSTMKSNLSVGPPIDIMCLEKDALHVTHRVRLQAGDAYLGTIRDGWSQGLTELVGKMPQFTWPDEK